jgi:hypothetical protein
MKGDATHEAAEHKYRVRVNSLLCEGAPLSTPSLARLKNARQAEYDAWKHTDFSELELVYWWADGLYVKAGLADRKAALSRGRAASIRVSNPAMQDTQNDRRVLAKTGRSFTYPLETFPDR